MKPQVTCLMASSVDGRTLHSRWRPKEWGADLFERVHDELAGDAWLVGRVTGQEFAKGNPYPVSKATFPREPWFARRDAKAYGVVLDAYGKIGWGRSDIGGDPIVVVLCEGVSDAHLAGLRGEGVSYIFAGKSELDLALALDILNRELDVKRLLLEGGGGANGAFLRAGLVDKRMDLTDLTFLLSDARIPVWWTQHPAEHPVLTGWFGGPKTEGMARLNEQELIEAGVGSLADIFGLDPKQLMGSLVAARAINWAHDPLAGGAYSYATPETRAARAVLSRIDGRAVFFSGEALYRGQGTGTVEAALGCGLETARTLLG